MSKISIDSVDYPYVTKFSKKAKRIRIQISSDKGLELIVPSRMSITEAEKLLESKKQWIKKHLKKIFNKEKEYFYFGEKLFIEQQFDMFLKSPQVELIGHKLLLITTVGNELPKQNIFDSWLRNAAVEYIPSRTNALAKKHGFIFNRLKIRGQKSRWGSCSGKGNLSFNFKLLSFRKEVIDYVIIHELCHLKEMNHSRKFWSLVELYLPDYKNYKKILKGIS
ncbi:MAG: SprT family zinc-dependent metalloprotease [Ignavibacteriales bacterium]|nr:SprT family zinc-dependent metalloprotease [Ignavibacteriales bacterium]